MLHSCQGVWIDLKCSICSEMRMEDPKSQFSYFVTQIRERFPDFGYVSPLSNPELFPNPSDLLHIFPNNYTIFPSCSRPCLIHRPIHLLCVQRTYRFIHVVEPRAAGNLDRVPLPGESNDFLREVWGSKPYIAAGGFTAEDAVKVAEEKGGLVAFGRYFIANVSHSCSLSIFPSKYVTFCECVS